MSTCISTTVRSNIFNDFAGNISNFKCNRRSARLCNKVRSSKFKTLDCYLCPFCSNTRKNDYRNLYFKFLALLKEFNTVHYRHFNIKKNYIRITLRNLIKQILTIFSLSAYFKTCSLINNAANKVSHQSGIITNQYRNIIHSRHLSD